MIRLNKKKLYVLHFMPKLLWFVSRSICFTWFYLKTMKKLQIRKMIKSGSVQVERGPETESKIFLLLFLIANLEILQFKLFGMPQWGRWCNTHVYVMTRYMYMLWHFMYMQKVIAMRNKVRQFAWHVIDLLYYRKQLETHWKNCGSHTTMLKNWKASMYLKSWRYVVHFFCPHFETLKKLWGHIALGLSVCPFICQSICVSHFWDLYYLWNHVC